MSEISQTTQWICKVCNWIYDEATGSPEHGLAPGTSFAAIPDDWYCPECGVTKADFEPMDV
ncbi:MAG: rubredoxin [Burkholderiaceae bacterium]